jgi:hypothetical protein
MDASATISSTPGSGGTYNYTLTLSDLSDSSVSIDSFWFAWVPGSFYLDAAPTGISGGNGWTGTAVGFGAGHESIQFVGGTAIAAGSSDTLTFTSTDTPAQMAAEVGGLQSVAYPGAIDASSPSETIAVTSVPEPSVVNLVVLGAFALGARVLGKKRIV